MALRTTALLSVTAVILAIIAHQSDPKITSAILSQSLEFIKKLSIKFNEYYELVTTYIHKTLGLNVANLWGSPKIRDEGAHPNEKSSKKGNKPKGVLLTKAELEAYNGEDGSPGTYVAILGSVFDVSSGQQHYGPGGGYHFFTGKDGTRAFVTGEFNEAGLTDDISGLESKDLKSLYDWLTFYQKDYKYVGKVIGNFYDVKGKPTKEYHRLLKGVKQAESDAAQKDKENQVMPPCNVEWNKENGLRVWCSTKSGGVNRAWAGVPRRLMGAGDKKTRCVCVEPKSAVSDPRLGEYENCPPGADTCWVPEDSDKNPPTTRAPAVHSSVGKMSGSAKQLIALDFEVFGLVQGVFFRKYTVQTGKKLGLRGWCMNTRHGSVLGQMEGEKSAVEEMKRWLSSTGSPSSRIDKADFRNEKVIEKLSLSEFTVHH